MSGDKPRVSRDVTAIVNASYSRRIEKVPTSNSRKGDMQDWLTSHGIEYPIYKKRCK